MDIKDLNEVLDKLFAIDILLLKLEAEQGMMDGIKIVQ